jgi:amidase
MSWVGSTAREIAEAVRNGKTTAAVVVEEHLAAIAARDPAIGAFRKVRAEEALNEARQLEDVADLPLAGVPIAIKDNVAVKGESTRNGSAATSEEPAAEDHPVVARLREAGAIVVGITTMPELALVAFSDSVYGTARNPWNLEHTPGGSSGGSAAAVAAGMVPLAHGNDGLGSLRIPAACCGLVTIKPGRRVIPPPERDWFGLCENGPLATTVSDLALAFEVMSGGEVRPDAEDLRIAVAANPLPIGFTVDKEFQQAVLDTGEALRAAGHTVVPHGHRLPTVLGLAIIANWYAVAAEEAALVDPRHLETRTKALARAGRAVRALRVDGRSGRERWRANGADQWFGNADVLVMPTLAHLPPKAERWGRRGLARTVAVNVRYAPATGVWNLAGWPAMSVPFGRHSSGLPIGVQLVAPPGGEGQLLALAAQLETANPWPRHTPL